MMSADLRAAGVVLVLSLWVASVRAQSPEQPPVPDALMQGESRKVAADLYRRDYTTAKGNKQALANLAQRMLQDATNVKDDAVSFYVLLDLAKDVATEAGDAVTAFAALDRIGESHDIDTLKSKAVCLDKIGTSRNGGSDYKTLAEQAFSLVDRPWRNSTRPMGGKA